MEVSLMPGYHSPQVEVDVRLNTNESPEPPPEEFLAELAEAARSLHANRYPDRAAIELRAAIAELHGVKVDNIFCANGSNEVLQCLFLAYGGPGRTLAAFEPTYALHSHIARLVGTEVVIGERDEHFQVDLGVAATLLDGVAARSGDDEPAITMLCSPNNPTGISEEPATVTALADLVPGLLVVDEAYAQFAKWSALELVADHPATVVVRTFSKTWALAALRLGYLVGGADVVTACERVSLPYHLDAFKQAAGTLALRHEPAMRERVARLVEARGRLCAALGDLPVTVWPSDANFVLFRLPGLGSSEVWRALIDRSVLVRDVSGWPGLEGCLRVTIGTDEENDRFVAALAEVLQAAGQ
jgi:histidinol-phosphate aminotransferase